MLEQPPEKSELEIAAELAAMAKRKIVRPSQALKFLQLVIWCSPLVACIMISAVFLWCEMAFVAVGYGPMILLYLTTCFISIYAIGYYDGIISQKTKSSLACAESGNLYLHALKFVTWQILFMPVLVLILTLISMGIYAICDSLSRGHP